MDKQQFKCTGDCLKCVPVQRQYCAAQNTYNAIHLLQDMQASINALTGNIEELKEKIKAIQDNEAQVFAPNMEQDIAQEGDGADQ